MALNGSDRSGSVAVRCGRASASTSSRGLSSSGSSQSRDLSRGTASSCNVSTAQRSPTTTSHVRAGMTVSTRRAEGVTLTECQANTLDAVYSPAASPRVWDRMLRASSHGDQRSTAVTHEHTDKQVNARNGREPDDSQAGSAGSTSGCSRSGTPGMIAL